MRINTKFPVAVHIMAVAYVIGEEYSTSEKLARSVDTNPVVIRRINAMLKKAKLVTVKPGVGGTALARAPGEISLLDIYNAVKASPEEKLFDMHSSSNPYCVVATNIGTALSGPLLAAQEAMEAELGRYTLADVLDNIPTLAHDELERQRKM